MYFVDRQGKEKVVRKAASILGILGGLAIFIPMLYGLLSTLQIASIGGYHDTVNFYLPPLAVAVTGVVGGARATAKPRSSGIMMLASGTVGLPLAFVYLVSLLNFLSSPFAEGSPSLPWGFAALFFGPPLMLIVGGALALRSR
ncbi:MAG TPA: hypothetical protein VI877_03510 [Dehalococcoidia bacterium]|nr:hypothetical protein [Dehalococcoidia bacterium]